MLFSVFKWLFQGSPLLIALLKGGERDVVHKTSGDGPWKLLSSREGCTGQGAMRQLMAYTPEKEWRANTNGWVTSPCQHINLSQTVFCIQSLDTPIQNSKLCGLILHISSPYSCHVKSLLLGYKQLCWVHFETITMLITHFTRSKQNLLMMSNLMLYHAVTSSHSPGGNTVQGVEAGAAQ